MKKVDKWWDDNLNGLIERSTCRNDDLKERTTNHQTNLVNYLYIHLFDIILDTIKIKTAF